MVSAAVLDPDFVGVKDTFIAQFALAFDECRETKVKCPKSEVQGRSKVPTAGASDEGKANSEGCTMGIA
jgi:hypothetical protein